MALIPTIDPAIPLAPKTREMFAEMYVAAMLADAGWELYFPRRDRGFDMIAVKTVASESFVRPIQVKGKYPTAAKTAKGVYGFVGGLTAWHDDMVVAMPYFSLGDLRAPVLLAWLPRDRIGRSKSGGVKCQPARYRNGLPEPRPGFAGVFGVEGLARLERR